MCDMKTLIGLLLRGAAVSFISMFAIIAHAAAPGITGLSFDLSAAPGYINQPDGNSIYSWGYGCNTQPSGFAPATITGATCSNMQLPGPTLIVNQGDFVTVTLHNNLPASAGNTSILFPGFDVTVATIPVTTTTTAPFTVGVQSAVEVALNFVSAITTMGGNCYAATDTLNITGGGGTGVTATITSITPDTTSTCVDPATGTINGITVTAGGSGYTSTPVVSITSIAGSGATLGAVITAGTGTVTITTSTAEAFTSGESVTIANMTTAGYNGTFTISSVINSMNFTYTNPVALGLASDTSATGFATANVTTSVTTQQPTGFPGNLTQEAAVGGTVTYTFVANTPGTHTYYSGTRGDLQIEMGLYGALIVLPTTGNAVPTGYVVQATGSSLPNTCHASGTGTLPNGGPDFRLAAAAYDHPSACYDREYLFQFSEIDPGIHRQAEEQATLPCTQATGCMVVATEPYVPAYFLINGRSMPDLMDSNYAVQYPHQPYNGNPHMHPGELTLLRVIGTGRWQHPFHEHGNHVRVLARDGNMLLSPSGKLAGPALFTTTTTPGMAMDGIFQWTGKGLNWDAYAHADGITTDVCVPDANGYYTTGSGALPTAPNYFEWCADHKKALEAKPTGMVGSGGPVTLPDANIMVNGAWYGGSPYLGPDATARAVGSTPIPPSGTVANDSGGFAFMWHSHNEREITTNNAFPGGMMMMMLVDPWVYPISEAK